MATSVAKPRRPARILLREDITQFGSPEKIDKDQGILYGVKALGLESQNGRRYTKEAIAAAKKFYEGLRVNVDHPAKPTDQRSAYDRIGWLEGVEIREDGLYANLHLLTSHELTPKILEAAEKNSNLFGLSHNALGEGENVDGVFVVGRITEVLSVDLVADPATTHGLFESKRFAVKKTVKEILESTIAKMPSDRRAGLVKLLEMGDSPPLDAEMDMPAEGGDWKADLSSAVAKLITSEDPEAHDTAKKIMGFLKPKSAPAAEQEVEDAPADGEKPVKESEDEDEEMPKKMEAIQRELNAMKRRESVRELCEAEQVQPSKALLKALCNLESEQDRKELLQEHKKLSSQAGNGNRPRSITRPASETQTGKKQATDGKSLAEAICR